MQLIKPQNRTRVVVPFPDVDPDFSVEMRRLSDAEISKIQTKHGFILGHPKFGLPDRSDKVNKEVLLRTVVRVNNATADGMVLDPESDATKLSLLTALCEVDGEVVSVFAACITKYDEMEIEEAKNSQSA